MSDKLKLPKQKFQIFNISGENLRKSNMIKILYKQEEIVMNGDFNASQKLDVNMFKCLQTRNIQKTSIWT